MEHKSGKTNHLWKENFFTQTATERIVVFRHELKGNRVLSPKAVKSSCRPNFTSLAAFSKGMMPLLCVCYRLQAVATVMGELIQMRLQLCSFLLHCSSQHLEVLNLLPVHTHTQRHTDQVFAASES